MKHEPEATPPPPAAVLDYAAPPQRGPGAVGRFLLTSIGWPSHLAGFVALLIVWEAASVPGTHFGGMLIGILAWLAVGAVWFLRGVLRVGAGLRYGIKPQSLTGKRRWLVLPILAFVCVASVGRRLPLHARFILSRGAMERMAQQVQADPNAGASTTRIGLYRVSRVEPIPGGMRFVIDGTGFLDRWGFAYSPNGAPASGGLDEYEHFRGPWYLWREIFD
jgi:hypothetical protein